MSGLVDACQGTYFIHNYELFYIPNLTLETVKIN